MRTGDADPFALAALMLAMDIIGYLVGRDVYPKERALEFIKRNIAVIGDSNPQAVALLQAFVDAIEKATQRKPEAPSFLIVKGGLDDAPAGGKD